jgi:hypothetical protein
VHPAKEAEHTDAPPPHLVFSLFNASRRRLLRPTRGRHPPLGPRRQRPTLALRFTVPLRALHLLQLVCLGALGGDAILRGSASRGASARAASTASASGAALWRAMGRWHSRRNGRERLTVIGGGAAAQLIRGCIGRLLEASSPSRVGPT